MQKSLRYLVTMPYGIGDTVHIGLAVIDQIRKNDPDANIDVLANEYQSEILADDPRIHVINISRNLFATQQKVTWYKVFLYFGKHSKLLRQKLKKRKYQMIFPGIAAFGFLHSIGGKVLYPNLLDIYEDAKLLKQYKNAMASIRSKSIINSYFGNKLQAPNIKEAIPLYIKESTYKRACEWYEKLQKNKTTKIILVATDSTSKITRPPTPLLKQILIPILKTCKNVRIVIIPSYTEKNASKNLEIALKDYHEKIFRIPQHPRPSLLLTAAICDLADVVVTGDTGVMHLSAARKNIITNGGRESRFHARNSKNTIAIFGGTNPGLYGHPAHTIIFGRGHPMQKKIRPGFFKEGYNPGKRGYFSHIHVSLIVAAVKQLLFDM